MEENSQADKNVQKGQDLVKICLTDDVHKNNGEPENVTKGQRRNSLSPCIHVVSYCTGHVNI